MRVNIVAVDAFKERSKRFGRLDPEFVDPDTLAHEARLLAEHNGCRLITYGSSKPATFQRRDETEGEARYVAIDDIDPADGFIFHQELPVNELPSRARFILEALDVLISNVRPERGAVGIVLPEQAGALGSSGLSVLRFKDEKTRNFLFAYLRTNSARRQIVRRNRGSMYPAVTKEDLDEIVIPKLPDNTISAVTSLVCESLTQRRDFYKNTLDQDKLVQAYLKDTLGNPPPDFVLEIGDMPSTHIVSSVDLFDKTSSRFDAEFFRRECVAYENALRVLPNVVPLGRSYTAFSGANPGSGKEPLYRLRQAQLSSFGINFAGLEAGEGRIITRQALLAQDVLLACTAHEPHYVGRRVDIVDEIPLGFSGRIMPVADVMIIRRKNCTPPFPTPSFLASFLRSTWGRLQVQRLNRGVRGGHVYGKDIENFIYIPVPSSEWLKGFHHREAQVRKARQNSIEKMKEAVALLEAQLPT